MLIRWPTSTLSSVDFPTLGRPTMATWPQRKDAGAVSLATRCSLSRNCDGQGHRRFGRGLLRGPAAGTFARRDDSQPGEAAFHRELLLVRLAAGRGADIVGDPPPPRLKPLP